MPLTWSTLCRVKLVPVAVQVAVPPPLAPPAATLVSDGLVAGERLAAWVAVRAVPHGGAAGVRPGRDAVRRQRRPDAEGLVGVEHAAARIGVVDVAGAGGGRFRPRRLVRHAGRSRHGAVGDAGGGAGRACGRAGWG